VYCYVKVRLALAKG